MTLMTVTLTRLDATPLGGGFLFNHWLLTIAFVNPRLEPIWPFPWASNTKKFKIATFLPHLKDFSVSDQIFLFRRQSHLVMIFAPLFTRDLKQNNAHRSPIFRGKHHRLEWKLWWPVKKISIFRLSNIERNGRKSSMNGQDLFDQEEKKEASKNM